MRTLAQPISRLALCLSIVSSLGGALGCAGREPSWSADVTEPAPPQRELVPPDELRARAEAAWAQRFERSNVEVAIDAWERLAALDPHDGSTLVALTRANYFLADAFLRAEETAYLATLDRAAKWGERALMVAEPEFERRIRGGERFPEAVDAVSRAGVPAMYWYASALGKWAKRKGLAVMIGQRDSVRAAMNRALELDPDFFHGGPHRYFGAYYAVMPEALGGDLEKSKVHFKKALEAGPKYVATKVLWAQELAVRLGDQALFERLLTEVLETPDDAIPELVAETLVEKQKAKALLAREAELF